MVTVNYAMIFVLAPNIYPRLWPTLAALIFVEFLPLKVVVLDVDAAEDVAMVVATMVEGSHTVAVDEVVAVAVEAVVAVAAGVAALVEVLFKSMDIPTTNGTHFPKRNKKKSSAYEYRKRILSGMSEPLNPIVRITQRPRLLSNKMLGTSSRLQIKSPSRIDARTTQVVL